MSMNALHRQSGSSLVEVLVAMLVLGTGILGISAMQASTLKNNQNSYMRTQAVFHSQDIVERMRSNQEGVEAGDYDDPSPVFNSNCTAAAGCTAAQMAANDVAEWEASVAAGLPLGSATICLDSDPDDGTPVAPGCDSMGEVYAVKIWWDDNRDGTANQRFVMTFHP